MDLGVYMDLEKINFLLKKRSIYGSGKIQKYWRSMFTLIVNNNPLNYQLVFQPSMNIVFQFYSNKI